MTELLTNMGEVSTALWEAAGDAANFVMTTPLAQVGVIVGIIAIGCGLASRFLFAH
jgi:hypothetical protein